MPNNTIPAAGEAAPGATQDAPTLFKLRDEWSLLESRIKFYCAGAESLAGDGTRRSCGAPLLRGTDDLIDYVERFEEMLDAYALAINAEVNA